MKLDRIGSGKITSLEEILHANCETAVSAANSFNASTSHRKHAAANSADVRIAINARRARDAFLPAHLFADPAWDMLLELYAAELDQVRMSTSNLCDASAVPATTALRWISTLENEGLIERQSDPLDARRIFVRLSSHGVGSMEAYFQR